MSWIERTRNRMSLARIKSVLGRKWHVGQKFVLAIYKVFYLWQMRKATVRGKSRKRLNNERRKS